MKRTRYSLRLDTPCSQSWEGMTPTSTGRHCGLCAKNVVDLTHLTDDQLLAFLKKSEGTFCGRVTNAQLNRPLVSHTESPLLASFFRVLAGIFLFTQSEASAQEFIERKPIPLVQAPTEQEKFETQKRDDPGYTQRIRVTGQVLARETQQPVAGVWVMVQGAGHTAVTEADGTFHILLPDSLFTESFRLHTLHREYGSVRTLTTVQDFPSLIELPPPRPVVTISGGGLVVVKRKWWQWRRKKECSG